MADSKLVNLPAKPVLDGTEELYINDTFDNSDKKITVEQILTTHKSGMAGSTVWLTPSSPRPFVDANEALRSVPKGGTLVLMDTYIINDSLGRPNLAFPYPITIRGAGWAEMQGPPAAGPRVVQPSQSYAKPPIHFNNADAQGNPVLGFARGAKVINVGISNSGTATAGIKIDHMSFTTVRDVHIHGRNLSLYGVHVNGESLAFRGYNLTIKRCNGAGVLETNALGGNHVLNDCVIEGGAVAAVHITSNDWTIRDGQYLSGSSGIAILIDSIVGGTGGSGSILIDNPRLEAHANGSTMIKFKTTDGTKVQTGIIRNPMCVASTYIDTVFMDIDDTENLIIENPIGAKWENPGTVLVRFGANTSNCTFVSLGKDSTGLVQDNGVGNRVIVN